MNISRRRFLQFSGAGTIGVMVGGLGVDWDPILAYADTLKIKGAKEITTICSFCAVGCGQIVHTKRGKVINIEGDADHPINEGTLCSKGAASISMVNNKRRLSRPLYRAPGSTKWEKRSWNWTLDNLARRIKDTRDKHSTTRNAKGNVVNRCDAIAMLGSACTTNEECYAWSKLDRALGMVYIDHQARI
ncbi:MAG: twin-arginine translocation signal domain-containing protein [Candidatus Binatia bacterium]